MHNGGVFPEVTTSDAKHDDIQRFISCQLFSRWGISKKGTEKSMEISRTLFDHFSRLSVCFAVLMDSSIWVSTSSLWIAPWPGSVIQSWTSLTISVTEDDVQVDSLATSEWLLRIDDPFLDLPSFSTRQHE